MEKESLIKFSVLLFASVIFYAWNDYATKNMHQNVLINYVLSFFLIFVIFFVFSYWVFNEVKNAKN